ncbi:class IV lanthionine synthetase LanL [Streptosporangium sp. NPDC001559]|uniref:class IV lanthionine synthetase LanL n=1 Tax=Streptosporangium sp. NPDC001559 TaxID=3366187 RepID=UPI0036F10003
MQAVNGGNRFDEDRHVLLDVATAALARAVSGPGDAEPRAEGGVVPGWEIQQGSPWTYVTPQDAATRPQGWKLHVSATPLSAPLVLTRVVEVLARHRCSFKFAATLTELSGLVSRDQNRGSMGKFVTVYPPDDEAAVAIAEELHTATYGLPGPPILSDRVYRPGSLVHYRFGVFSAPSELDNDGTYASRLTAPDGTRVTDERNAWYSPPAWAPCPFESGQAAVRTAAPESVLLADRFVVRQALRHSAKGGVFLAEDRTDGGMVVIKQARPHLGASIDGRDERDLLRHEARMLELFGPLGVTARKAALFETGGNLFLAQEHLAGTPLSVWVNEQRSSRPAAEWRETVVGLARRMTALVSTVHGRGYVLRDLTPNNVMVSPDDECLLIDLEMAAVPGTPVGRAYTPGYAPPEQVLAAHYGPAPEATVDLFALGATLFFLATGCQPSVPEDLSPEVRPWESRLRTLLSVVTADDATATALAPMILGLMREEPSLRWDLTRVRAFLDELADGTGPSPSAGGAYRLSVADQDRLLGDGLAHVLRTISPSGPGGGVTRRGSLWPVTGFGMTADPCALQYGSAGVLTLLAAVVDPELPSSSEPGTGGDLLTGSREDLTAGLRQAADWTVRRLAGEPRPSPGLYFGRAGIAWSLYEAGRALDDASLRAQGLDMARGLPDDWPNPDICHGLAGTGLALLHFWHATGDTEFRDKADRCADALLKVAQRTPEAVLWRIPPDFDSALAGVLHYGFGHGVAGIGAYLLAAGTALGRDDCLETAVAAGETLLAAAIRQDDAAWWAESPGGVARKTHWCSGSSGVGTFLVRLYAATGEPRFRDAAEAAAVAVHSGRLHMGTAACHGLAGDGQFLLDMADLLDEPAYRERAEELAACLWARAMLHDGLLLVADEGGHEVSLGWNTGMAGVLDFLLRLRHGGPRPWMADEPKGAPVPAAAAGRAR